VILGTAAVTKRGLYAVQTQSYGSEARGGQCQAELIISDQPINSPMVDKKDLLIALSQSALDRYLPSLRPGRHPHHRSPISKGYPWLQRKDHCRAGHRNSCPFREQISANMVILGFLQQSTGFLTKEDLVAVIKS
jgi:2-oxoglutarate ferredoxin oxidoreductase subunit gamma